MTMFRFMFKISSWKPTQNQILRAGNSIQIEEEKRAAAFHFQNDAKSALVGRLLLRYAICKMTGLEWDVISLSRTEKGKPILNASDIIKYNDVIKNLSFNISHQGDFVLAVISTENQVGIDVMNIDEKHGKADEFFRLMNRNFSSSEWSMIKSPQLDSGKMMMFYRHWCLKESLVKAIGDGIGYSLQRISFLVNSNNEEFVENGNSRNISLKIDENSVEDWIFQEDLIDTSHCSATAVKCTNFCKNTVIIIPKFTDVNIDNLLDCGKPLRQCDNSWFWEKFQSKPMKPKRHR